MPQSCQPPSQVFHRGLQRCLNTFGQRFRMTRLKRVQLVVKVRASEIEISLRWPSFFEFQRDRVRCSGVRQIEDQRAKKAPLSPSLSLRQVCRCVHANRTTHCCGPTSPRPQHVSELPKGRLCFSLTQSQGHAPHRKARLNPTGVGSA